MADLRHAALPRGHERLSAIFSAVIPLADVASGDTSESRHCATTIAWIGGHIDSNSVDSNPISVACSTMSAMIGRPRRDLVAGGNVSDGKKLLRTGDGWSRFVRAEPGVRSPLIQERGAWQGLS